MVFHPEYYSFDCVIVLGYDMGYYEAEERLLVYNQPFGLRSWFVCSRDLCPSVVVVSVDSPGRTPFPDTVPEGGA